MQKVRIKEINPAQEDNKPTIIIDENGAKMSGFDTKLKSLKPGALIEAELEVKGKYTNIKDFKVLEEGTEPAEKKSNGYGKSLDVVKLECQSRERINQINRVSIEGQVALKELGEMIRTSGGLNNQDVQEEANLWKEMVRAKLIPFADSTDLTPPGRGQQAEQKSEGPPGKIEIDWSPINNAGELFSRCKNYNISRDHALEIFPHPMNDFDAAWEKIVEVKFQIKKPTK